MVLKRKNTCGSVDSIKISDFQYDYSISICRILGAVMIIICHIGTALDNSLIGQSFQAGVQLFLFISGYLYGKKKIQNYTKWIKNRFFRICIPCYLFIAYCLSLSIIMGLAIDPRAIFMDVFNIEGYHHILTQTEYINQIPGSAHLWFITALLLCYTIMLLINRINNDKMSRINGICFIYILITLTIVLGLFGIRIDYILIYFIGYYYAQRTPKKYDYLISVLCLILGITMRLFVKRYCDYYGDNFFYLYVIIPASYNLLAFWLFKTITIFRKTINHFCTVEAIRKFILYFDGLSFFVYITHYQFIDSPLCVVRLTNNMAINMLILIIAIFVSANLLKIVSDKVVLWLERAK